MPTTPDQGDLFEVRVGGHARNSDPDSSKDAANLPRQFPMWLLQIAYSVARERHSDRPHPWAVDQWFTDDDLTARCSYDRNVVARRRRDLEDYGLVQRRINPETGKPYRVRRPRRTSVLCFWMTEKGVAALRDRKETDDEQRPESPAVRPDREVHGQPRPGD